MKQDISKIQQKKIEELISKGKRMDGRHAHEFRKIEAEINVINKAEGSARVKFGESEVLVGVKLNVGEPYTDSPDEGTLVTSAELLPMASEEFESGPPKIDAIEVARLVDRGIRESSFIDFKKLCIKEGELVWNIFIDIYPINWDGNLIDAAAFGAILALKSAYMPKLTEKDKVDFGNLSNKRLPLTENVPITITVNKIGKSFILDTTAAEEKAICSQLTFAVSKGDDKELHINALQKNGDALTEEEIFEMIDLGMRESKRFFDLFEKITEKKEKKE